MGSRNVHHVGRKLPPLAPVAFFFPEVPYRDRHGGSFTAIQPSVLPAGKLCIEFGHGAQTLVGARYEVIGRGATCGAPTVEAVMVQEELSATVAASQRAYCGSGSGRWRTCGRVEGALCPYRS